MNEWVKNFIWLLNLIIALILSLSCHIYGHSEPEGLLAAIEVPAPSGSFRVSFRWRV